MSGRSSGELGDLLLQCQRDLQSVRDKIDELPSETGQHAAIYNSLRSVLQRAEANLQDKATMAMKHASYTPLNSLPSIGSQAAGEGKRGGGGSGGRLRRAHSPHSSVLEKMKEKKVLALAANPQLRGARQMLAEKYGLRKARRPRPRPVGRHSGSRNVRKGNVDARPKILPKINRKYPHAPLPQLTRDNLEEGLYNLVNRGAIPKDAEISGVAQEGTIRNRAAVFHDFHEQFEKTTIAAIHGVDIASIRFDYSEDIRRVEAEKKIRRARAREQAMLKETAEKTIMSTVVVREDTKKQPEVKQAGLAEAQPPPPSSGSGEGKETKAIAKQEVRDYDQLLDQYSLHQFIIRKGKVLDTPEFVSFQRKYGRMWGPISAILQLLESLVGELGVDMVLCNGTRLVALAENEMQTPSRAELMACLGDMDSRPLEGKRALQGPNKFHRAAVKVQSVVRMFTRRKQFKVVKFRNDMARRIQKLWRGYSRLKKTRAYIARLWSKRLSRWRSTIMGEFRRKWGHTCRKRRLEVHVPSISIHPDQRKSMHNFSILENTQMTRLCVLKDPLVEVIYISPFRIPEEVLGYFFTLLEVAGIPSPRSRVHVCLPENAGKFPEHFSLSKKVLYSPVLMKKLKRMVKGRPTYIVPGDLGAEDLQLAVELDLPLMSGEPDVAALLGSKTGCRRVFQQAGVGTAVGVHGIYDEKDFFKHLSMLVVEHIDTKRWMFKIDHERGGRGTAYLDLMAIQVYRAVLRERDADLERWRTSREFRSGCEIRILIALQGEIAHKVRFARAELHQTWDAFAAAFFRVGGVIEAVPNTVVSSPSSNLFIEPDGTVHVTSTHDQIFMKPYVFCGMAFPSAGPHDALYEATYAIGQAAYKSGLVGYVGVDYVLAYDAKAGEQTLMAVDLNPRITASCATYLLFHCLANGRFHPALGEYRTRVRAPGGGVGVGMGVGGGGGGSGSGSTGELVDGPKRFYTAIDYVYQPRLAALQFNTFFNACRLRNVSYDMKSRQGTVFIMIDSLASGSLGLMSIGRDLLSEVAVETQGRVPGDDYVAVEPGALEATRLLVDALLFIREQLNQLTRQRHVFASYSTFERTLAACQALQKRMKAQLERSSKHR
mmetsp:Transcript_3573/g.7186  ORF Transcript_3573/g.7186 Transcript_3573/m.7186 type:complete len:1110 (+) Transcript_3573:42-3371(+)